MFAVTFDSRVANIQRIRARAAGRGPPHMSDWSSPRLRLVSEATPSEGAGRKLARDLALYTVARLGLVVALVALILGAAALVNVEVPLIVAALFAVLIALPLSMVLFKTLRTRVNQDIAAVDAKRRSDRDQLMTRLRGDEK